MPTADRRSLPSLLAWFVLFVPVTLWLLAGLIQQPVDPANRALNEPGSAAEANLRRLAEIVPSEPVVLLAFEKHDLTPLQPADQAAIEQVQKQLEAVPGVVHCATPPNPTPQLALLPVSIEGRDLGQIADAVVAAAKASAGPALHVMATGHPLLEGTIARLVAGERTGIVPLLLAVLLLAAGLLYRHVGLAIATVLPAVAAIAWTGGIVARLGHQLDPIASLLDPVLLTIGVAASVHFVEAYRRARAQGLEPRRAVDQAATELRTPALLATATTMIGLWSLATSSIPAVADFGVRAALGVSLTHFFTFLILPAWLPCASRRAPLAAPAGPSLGTAWLAFLNRHRLGLGLATLAASGMALAGLPRLHPDNDPLRLVPASDQVRIDHNQLAERLGGVEVFHLLVPAHSLACEPSRLLPFVAALREMPGIAGFAGPVQRGPLGDLAVPMLLQPAGSAVREPLFTSIERTSRVLGFPEVVPAGTSVQIALDSHHLMHSLFGSLCLSFGLLAAGMCVGLRSLRLGLLGMLPNLLPSLWVYGLLGWLDRPVSVATAMIGCTMLGLIVDNTLHLLHHYRKARTTRPARSALREALDHCGRAMTLSSFVLFLGFLVAATSKLETTIEFALLASTTIAAAWFGVAVVLPLLLVLASPANAPPTNGPHAL